MKDKTDGFSNYIFPKNGTPPHNALNVEGMWSVLYSPSVGRHASDHCTSACIFLSCYLSSVFNSISSLLPFTEPPHFTSFCSLHFVRSFLWLCISPSTFCIHLLSLRIRSHSFIFNPSFLACITDCPFCVYLLFPLLWLSSVFHLHPPSYLYVYSRVFSPYLSTHDPCSQHSSIAPPSLFAHKSQ